MFRHNLLPHRTPQLIPDRVNDQTDTTLSLIRRKKLGFDFFQFSLRKMFRHNLLPHRTPQLIPYRVNEQTDTTLSLIRRKELGFDFFQFSLRKMLRHNLLPHRTPQLIPDRVNDQTDTTLSLVKRKKSGFDLFLFSLTKFSLRKMFRHNLLPHRTPQLIPNRADDQTDTTLSLIRRNKLGFDFFLFFDEEIFAGVKRNTWTEIWLFVN